MLSVAANGRPLRFFALLLLGWVITRFTLASDMPPPPHGPPPIGPMATASALMAVDTAIPPSFPLSLTGQKPIGRHRANIARRPEVRHGTGQAIFPTTRVRGHSPALAAITGPDPRFARRHPDLLPAPHPPLAPPLAVPLASGSGARTSDRWQGSAWLLWRSGQPTAADLASTGRLGGSQAGIRLDFDLTQSARDRLAAYGRVTSALNSPSTPEAAIGLSYQPARTIPVSIAVERRLALDDHARNAMSLMLVGGFGPTPVAGPVMASGYAQTGVVGLRSRDLFIDGRLALLSSLKGTAVRIGGSISGGAQPQVERLDIGPTIQVTLPLQQVAARIDIEWRERIIGRAAPASGLAVTLAADF